METAPPSILAGQGVDPPPPSSLDPSPRGGSVSPIGREKKSFKESFIATDGGIGPVVRSSSTTTTTTTGSPLTDPPSGGPSSRTGYALTPDAGSLSFFGGPKPTFGSSSDDSGVTHASSAGASTSSSHPLTSSSSKERSTALNQAIESRSAWDSEASWLGLYFFFNLGLTLFNKIVLVSFPFPYVRTSPAPTSWRTGVWRRSRETDPNTLALSLAWVLLDVDGSARVEWVCGVVHLSWARRLRTFLSLSLSFLALRAFSSILALTSSCAFLCE